MTKLQNIDEERSLCFDSFGGYEFDEDDTIESSDIYTSSDDDSDGDDVISIDSNSNDNNNSVHSREVISKKRKRRKPSRRGRSGYPTPFSDNDSNRLRRSALNLNAISEESHIDDNSNQEELSPMSTTQHTCCEDSLCSEYSIGSSSSHFLPYTFIKTDLMGHEVESIVGKHSQSFRKSPKTTFKTSKWKTVLFEPSSGSDLSSYSRAGTPPSLNAPTKHSFSQSFRTLKKFPSAAAAAPTSSWKPKTTTKSLEDSLPIKMPARPSSYLQLDFGPEDSADSDFGKVSTSQKELSTVELVTSALSAVELVSSEQHSKKKKNSCSNKRSRSQKGTAKSKPKHKKSNAGIKTKTKSKPTYRTTPTKQQREGSNHSSRRSHQYHCLDTSSNSTQTESTHSITSHSSNTIDNIDEQPSSISPRHHLSSNSLVSSPWSKSLSLPVFDNSSSKPTMLSTNSPSNKNDTPRSTSLSNNYPDRPPFLPKRRSRRKNSRRNSGVSSRRSGMRNNSIPAGDLGVFSGLSIRSKKRRKRRRHS